MKPKLQILLTLFFCSFIAGLGVLVWLTVLLGNFCAVHFGPAGSLVALVLALWFFFFVYLRQFYRIGDWFDVQHRAELREKHKGIYRVQALPTKSQRPNNWCAEEITIGDFGWESRPLTKDGLIWLQGLTTEWKMAWRAGFKPEEIEFVGSKPVSQYDWKDFEYDGPKATSIWSTAIPKHHCPYPVQKETKNRRLQFPITSY